METKIWLRTNFEHWANPIWGAKPLVLAAILLGILIIWTLIWKGMALWKSARRGDTVWFIVLLVVNTVGILEILYIYFFSKKYPPKD